MTVLIALLCASAPQDEQAVERMLQAVERRHAAAGDPSDVPAAARKLGHDRDRILKFVREDIALEPYEGILRGAGGALLFRGGNDLDRSLLLAALLQAGGIQARVVRGDLSDADRSRLLEFLSKRKSGPSDAGDVKGAAELLGVDAAALEALVRERKRREAALIAEISEAARSETSRILALTDRLPGGALRLSAHHYWVQYSEGGRWVDLDPSPVELSRTAARPVSDADLKKLRRTVSFKIVLTRKVADKSDTVPLLSVGFDALDIAWQDVDLVINPEDGQLPKGEDLAKLDAKGRADALRKVKIWRPGLIVDGKPYGAAPFDLEGKVYEVSRGGQVGIAREFGGALNDAFGGILGGGEKPKSTLVSVDLEIAVSEPGLPARTHRRRLFAPGGRTMAFQSWSFLVETAVLPAGEKDRRMVVWFAANAPALRALIRGDKNAPHFNLHADVSPTLLEMADLRRRLQEGRLAFRDRLGIFAEIRQVVDDGSEIRGFRSIDILENAVIFASPDGRIDTDAAVAMGVADTILESLLLVRDHPSTAAPSAWNLLSRARIVGGKGRKVKGGVSWEGTDAWWSVDPETGSCVGRVPSGAGQGAIEYAWDLSQKVCQFADLYTIYGAGTGPGAGAVSTLSDFCSVVQGTIVRDKLRDTIIKRTQEMWIQAANALAGM